MWSLLGAVLGDGPIMFSVWGGGGQYEDVVMFRIEITYLVK